MGGKTSCADGGQSFDAIYIVDAFSYFGRGNDSGSKKFLLSSLAKASLAWHGVCTGGWNEMGVTLRTGDWDGNGYGNGNGIVI